MNNSTHMQVDFKINLFDLYNSIPKTPENKIEVIERIVKKLIEDFFKFDLKEKVNKLEEIKKKNLVFKPNDLGILQTKEINPFIGEYFNFTNTKDLEKKYTIIRFNNVTMDPSITLLHLFRSPNMLDFFESKPKKKVYHNNKEKSKTLLENRYFPFYKKKDKGDEYDTFMRRIVVHKERNQRSIDEDKIEYFINFYKRTCINLKTYILWYIYFYKIRFILKKCQLLRTSKILEGYNDKNFAHPDYIVTLNLFFKFINYSFKYGLLSEESYGKKQIILNYKLPSFFNTLLEEHIIEEETYKMCKDMMTELLEKTNEQIYKIFGSDSD